MNRFYRFKTISIHNFFNYRFPTFVVYAWWHIIYLRRPLGKFHFPTLYEFVVLTPARHFNGRPVHSIIKFTTVVMVIVILF